jgi:hypothetical protein
MQVERKQAWQQVLSSGARVRNTYATYPLQVHNPEKLGLIGHSILNWHRLRIKDLSVKDGHAPH